MTERLGSQLAKLLASSVACLIHGLFNSLITRYLAQLTKGFVFVNLGITFVVMVALLAKTPRADMHVADYIFGTAGIVNQTEGWNTGLAFFLFNGLCPFVTVPNPIIISHIEQGYDVTAHISLGRYHACLNFFFSLCHAERKFVAQHMQICFHSIHPFSCI